jgi:RND superfamily putative drug exporter
VIAGPVPVPGVATDELRYLFAAMERWTRLMIRLRWPVVIGWLVVLVVGNYAGFSLLPSRLINELTIPGTDSERARVILKDQFGDRDVGNYLVVARVADATDQAQQDRFYAYLVSAAAAIPTGRPEPVQAAGPHVLFASIQSDLSVEQAQKQTKTVRRVLHQMPGGRVYVSGNAAIAADVWPIAMQDMARGEGIAIPVALLVLVAVFGVSLAVGIPFLMAASSIGGTLGIVYLASYRLAMPQQVINLVELVGLGVAIDYSLLIVYRFREELARGGEKDDVIVRTMRTAGRAVMFSGATVAIGLGLLLLMPIPFMRAVGLGAFLIPLLSVAAAATLQPALLSLFSRRSMSRAPVMAALRRGFPLRVEIPIGAALTVAGAVALAAGAGSLWPLLLGLPLGLVLALALWALHVPSLWTLSLPPLPIPRLKGEEGTGEGLWASAAGKIMRHPIAFLLVGGAVLVAAAAPALGLRLTPGTMSSTPHFPESIQGFDMLAKALGPGALAPTQVVVDSGRPGGARVGQVAAAIDDLTASLGRDPEVALATFSPAAPFVDVTGRYARITVVGRHEYGDPAAGSFVERVRKRLVPAASFPLGTRVYVGGGPAGGFDFQKRLYQYFPLLVGGVLLLTYLLLMRAFRSLFLPLKAVALNLLSVGAAYGLLVIFFSWGAGHALLGNVYQQDLIEGWIPVILFAMLFGLSMDYEVFLVTRMREVWDEGASNEQAVREGLEKTGRIVTAAAVIMVAAFSGFVAGRLGTLQEFGFGLAAAILFDATIIRALLVPSLMALFGRYNWWLPAPLARLVRIAPSPLAERS